MASLFLEIELRHGKTTIHSSKTDDICLCLILVINHPLSYCAGYSMPLCRHSIAFSICLRDRQTAKSCFEQVVPGDVHCCVAMVCLCCCLRCMLSTISSTRTVRPHFSLLPQLLLVTTRHARERKEQGLALRQEQSGCSRFRSFLYAFWSLRFSFSAAASSFVQDSIKNFQKKGFPESLFCRFFWSNQLSQTITRMITKR